MEPTGAGVSPAGANVPAFAACFVRAFTCALLLCDIVPRSFAWAPGPSPAGASEPLSVGVPAVCATAIDATTKPAMNAELPTNMLLLDTALSR